MPDAPASLTVTLLGTGTSTGVPVIGCTCDVCTSDDPRDTRLRCSALVEYRSENGILSILLDAGPDFRQQALAHDIRRIDAVCFTHAHFDHVAGMDDLRPFFYTNRSPIPCFGRRNAVDELRTTNPYIFSDNSYTGAPLLQLRPVSQPFTVRSRHENAAHLDVIPIDMRHGELPVYGYRIGRFAYLTDCSHIPETEFEKLEDLDVLILDALRRKPHNTHFSISEAVKVAQRIGAEETYFTHMTHSIRHEPEERALPDGIHLGYDGLELTCGVRTPADASVES